MRKIRLKVVTFPQKKKETNNTVSEQVRVDVNIGIPCIPSHELHGLLVNYIMFSTASGWELQTIHHKPPAIRLRTVNIICTRLHFSKIVLFLAKELCVQKLFFIFLVL